MYKLRFFLAAPHASPRQLVAEADSLHDCAYKALEEAHEKAAIIANALAQALALPPIKIKSEPVTPERLLADARCLEVDATLGYRPESRGYQPMPRLAKVNLEITVSQDSGQLPLFDVSAQPPMPSNGKPTWKPSGDYAGYVELQVLDDQPPVQIAQVEYASTTASAALGRTVETARQLITQLKKDSSTKPIRKYLNFKKVRVTVEQVNTTIPCLDIPDESWDWSQLEYPAPRF